MELLSTILITLFTLAILIAVHEYGHFWVARKLSLSLVNKITFLASC